jgi:hypothetical protein
MYRLSDFADAKSKGSLRVVVSLASRPGVLSVCPVELHIEAVQTRPNSLIVAKRRFSSMNWVRKAGKSGGTLTDVPNLRFAPAGAAAPRKSLAGIALCH